MTVVGEHYTLTAELGRGGMAVVHRARDVRHGRDVAVKMMLPAVVEAIGAGRFLHEIETVARLQHPHIVAIHEVGEHEGRHYFSMDYVDGKNLAQLAAGKPIPALKAARHVRTIAEAIHFAHQRGVLHRDLKPQSLKHELELVHAILQNFPWLKDKAISKITIDYCLDLGNNLRAKYYGSRFNHLRLTFKKILQMTCLFDVPYLARRI